MFVILTVCMLGNPAHCKEGRVRQSVEEGAPLSCIVAGQSTVAIWASEQPAWHVDKWKCVPESRLDTNL